MKKPLLLSAGLVLLGGMLVFLWKEKEAEPSIFLSDENALLESELRPLEPKQEKEITADVPSVEVVPPENAMRQILQEVPFLSQAPTGNWSDLIFQNACEEASLLMAARFVNGETFGTAEEMAREIRDITRAEWKYFPEDSYDLSGKDTLFLAEKLYPEMNISLVRDVGVADIKKALFKGAVIIIPANGQKLGNPNFTPPGPLYHTLLIRGYDPKTDEFIVNDPGTRRGAAYRYSADILFASMHDYETGYHGKLFPNEKVMLVVEKE